MDAIAAVDENWGIGQNGKLLFSIPADLHYFKETTWGGLVIMGRRTLDALPGGRPLPGREHVVLTRGEALAIPGVRTVHTVEQALQAAKSWPGAAWVIGGGQIYRALLPYCRRAFVTKVEAAGAADTFFPNLEKDPAWHLAQAGRRQAWEGLCFSFCIYENRGAAPW